jgi:RimJ/RimL family protein N-acetyltransferase
VQDIVTERPLLRPLQLEDVPAFAAYRRDPDVARYQSWDTAYSQADGEQHGIHRVYAQADDRNVPVHRLLERLGLRCEARLLDADWFKREWTTLSIYAAFAR